MRYTVCATHGNLLLNALHSMCYTWKPSSECATQYVLHLETFSLNVLNIMCYICKPSSECATQYVLPTFVQNLLLKTMCYTHKPSYASHYHPAHSMFFAKPAKLEITDYGKGGGPGGFKRCFPRLIRYTLDPSFLELNVT